jgi:hypothetical protein
METEMFLQERLDEANQIEAVAENRTKAICRTIRLRAAN